MASLVFNYGKVDILGSYDWTSTALKVMLVQTTYTPNADDQFVSTITNATSKESTGTGYTGGFNGSGRKTLASPTVTVDLTNDRAVASAANVTWTAINVGTVAAAVIIKEVTTDSDSHLIAYMDFTDVVTNGGDLTVQWSAFGSGGIFYI